MNFDRILSEPTRKVWSRKIRSFWLDYSHNKIGLLGLAMLIFFVFIATFSEVLAPFRPEQVQVQAPWQADRYAMPNWITIFPGFQDLPPQQVHRLNWIVEQQPPASINLTSTSDFFVVRYNASVTNSYAAVTVYFNASFSYPYSPMKIFTMGFFWEGSPDQVVKTLIQTPWGPKPWGNQTGSMDYKLTIDLVTPNGTFPIWDQNWWELKDAVNIIPPAFWNKNASQDISMYSTLGDLAMKLGLLYGDVPKICPLLFSTKGLYTLRLGITMRPGTIGTEVVPLANATGHISFRFGSFTVWGRRFGLLGTDHYGKDVFTQLMYGSRISMIVGISAAVIATLIGIVIGVAAGYVGGWTDEALMRMVDVLICLPLLPVLLVFVAMFGYNPYYLIIMLSIFGWQGLSRVIRSQTLSLREMAFVESAVASGGTRGYIMFKHLLPNVLPVAFTSLVLRVPGAVILEAALSFIGMGDPYSPTWGKILYNAQQTGAFNPQILAWWNVVPPGMAITALCLTFVFIQHAVDEIVNPRLRRRR